MSVVRCHAASQLLIIGLKLVFQMSLRIALGNDIAADPSTVRYAVTAYRWMNQSATPDGMVLPFIPTPKRIRCILAGMRLYNLVKKAIAVRKHDGKPRVDVLQSLLDEDMDLMDCMKVRFLPVVYRADLAAVDVHGILIRGYDDQRRSHMVAQ